MRVRKRDLTRLAPAILALLLAVTGYAVPAAARGVDRPSSKLVDLPDEVRHQLVMLPYYSVFDDLEYEVKDGGVVVLSGEVVRPVLKSDAENIIRRLPGVSKVEDDIKVLPLSSFDDRIRIQEYRAIYRTDQLFRYVLNAVPPIHIIVDQGRVTLVGVVATEADRNLAGIVANTVPGVFKVTNDLAVEKKGGTP